MLIAVQNAQADLRAGFTAARDMTSHGNGYADVALRDAINQGRLEGPRLQVSTLGIVWSNAPATTPQNPLAGTVIRSIEEARMAVQEQVRQGADWIKLYHTGNYSFTPTGDVDYVLTYAMPVLQALIDEAHRLGRKTACHVFGGDGQKNAIDVCPRDPGDGPHRPGQARGDDSGSCHPVGDDDQRGSTRPAARRRIHRGRQVR